MLFAVVRRKLESVRRLDNGEVLAFRQDLREGTLHVHATNHYAIDYVLRVVEAVYG